MQVRRLIPAGIAGAMTPAVLTICVTSLSFILLENLALTALYLSVLAIIVGTDAAFLTNRIWRTQTLAVAYLLGFVGYVVGLGAGWFVALELFPTRTFDKLGGAEKFLLFFGIAIVVATLSQSLVMLLLVTLRQAYRLTTKPTSASRPGHDE